MTDLTDWLQAATVAIRDIAPDIEAGGPKLHTLTVELEVDMKGWPVGATAWLEHRVNIGKLLGVGRG